MGAHRRGWQYIRFILDDSVIRLSVLPVKSVTLQAVEFPNSPCGLSRVLLCECEWRCVECGCGLRCFVCVCECRLASGNLTNRRTAAGTCPRSGAEGSKPQQQHQKRWKAEKSRVGWSLVGCYQFEPVSYQQKKRNNKEKIADRRYIFRGRQGQIQNQGKKWGTHLLFPEKRKSV